jgi:triacylglycerol lipase
LIDVAPLWLMARGAALEVGWAAFRVAGIPMELTAGGLRYLVGRLGQAVPGLSTVQDGSQSGPSGPGMPVLLVHGLADRASVFTRLRRGLQDCGVGPLITVTNGVLPDIRQAARTLGDSVEQAQADSGGRPVCVIGHSLGGLIARYYVQRLGGDAHVALVITLGTPHSGTAAAVWAPPHPLFRQLRPGSELVRELAEPAAGCRTRFVAFYSDLDEAVIPTSRARIDHPDLDVRNVLTHGVGHLALPIHTPVIDEIRRELADTGEDLAEGMSLRGGVWGRSAGHSAGAATWELPEQGNSVA